MYEKKHDVYVSEYVLFSLTQSIGSPLFLQNETVFSLLYG